MGLTRKDFYWGVLQPADGFDDFAPSWRPDNPQLTAAASSVVFCYSRVLSWHRVLGVADCIPV